MSDITLVTPPDKYYSQEYSFLLVYPSAVIKSQFQDLVETLNKHVVVYLYEKDEDDHEPEWLLDCFYKADCVILDIDNCDTKVRDLTSYFIAKDKTFWLTNSGDNMYNTLSKNRIFNLDFLSGKLGD
jgi:hypothetical protein